MLTFNKAFTLVGPDGKRYSSSTPGTFGGHRAGKLYGRLDCRTALQAIARGGYVKHRVFFADEATAIAAGYRPCAVCTPREYAAWKKIQPAQASRQIRLRRQRLEHRVATGGLGRGDLFLHDVPVFHDLALPDAEDVDRDQRLRPPAGVSPVNHHEVTLRDRHAGLVREAGQRRNHPGDR